MSRKNRKTRTTTDGDRHLHAVADDPSQQNAPTTEDKVRKALTDIPCSTTVALAMAAGVGRSTAAKILARWGRDGTAIRTAGDGPRNPDTWTLAPSTSDTAAPDTEDARPDATTTPHTDKPTDHATDITTEDTVATEEADTDYDSTTTLPDTAPGEPVDNATETEPSLPEPPAVADTTSTGKDRLPKGELRALTEEYLTDHPGESFGPAKIGKDLGRSGGAVNNALEKLVAEGYAIKTCEAPKRFAINPDKTDAPATAEDTDESTLEA